MNILKAAISWLLTKHVKKEQPKMSKIALAVSSAYVLTVTVTDDSDVPVVGAGVVLTGDAGLSFAPNTLTTGDAGTATSTLAAPAGTYTATATLADGTTASTSVTFAALATADVTPAAEIKTGVQDFEKAFQFVADGVVSLGEGAKDELLALAKKYL